MIISQSCTYRCRKASQARRYIFLVVFKIPAQAGFVTTQWQLCERTVAWGLFPCEAGRTRHALSLQGHSRPSSILAPSRRRRTFHLPPSTFLAPQAPRSTFHIPRSPRRRRYLKVFSSISCLGCSFELSLWHKTRAPTREADKARLVPTGP